MSQVIRKFENSGKIEQSKPELFERSGVGKYNKADLVAGLYRNIDTYIKHNNLSGDRAVSFRNYANQFIKGIENGTISMNGDGTFSDSTGNLASTGKFDTTWTGHKKDTANNAMNLVGHYALDYINQMQQYTEPAAKPKGKFNPNDLLAKEISKRWYGGREIDFDNWFKNRGEKDRNALIGEIFNNLDYNQLYQDYDWTDTGINSVEDLANRGKAFGAAISNNTLDNDDYNTFATLGGSGLNKFLKETPQTGTPQQPSVEGQQGKTDTSWNNSEYDRTIDDKGKYHIYKKGTNQEINGILPGNVFEGAKNRYVFNGNFYDDSNLPEQYQQDILRARQAQLNEYTKLSDDNPFTKMLRGQGYNYITNLSQFAPGVGDNILYGVYSNPSDVNGKMAFYLRNPNTGKANRGSVEFNKTLGQYQFIGGNGNVINLGAYNAGGTRSNQGTSFVNYNDTSEGNMSNLFNTWMMNSDLSNPASEAHKMVQTTLSKWIASDKSPFVSYNGNYQWQVGDNVMNVRKGADGQWQWKFNGELDKPSKLTNQQLEAITRNSPKARQISATVMGIPVRMEDGGVVTAQLGTKFTRVEDAPIVPQPQVSEEQARKNRIAHQSFTGRNSISLGNNKDITSAGGVLKTSDKVRLGAAIADLASIGLGFVPGANLASAGIGLGASVTEFGADWASDGLDLGDIGRLGMNLGMDALSLIPVGKTMKATRALGKIKKSIPLIMTLINASNLLDPTLRESYGKTLSKLSNGDIKSLNTGDFKNLSAIASTVLGTKNFAQSRKGWWNSSTTPSGKKRVTAMINGKQQALEVDDAFFQNTKGKNQVTELKTKFADEYNKSNGLEGDKAITADDVAVDTKYFGRRPQSEEVEGTKTEGNWLSDNFVGKHLLRYKDPSVVRGNENIPFSDAWFLKSKSPSTTSPSVAQPKTQVSQEVTTPKKPRVASTKKPTRSKKEPAKSRKKSTSKEVTKKAEGGVVQFLQDGKAVSRIKAKDMSGWNRANALANYDFGADVDRWKSGYTGSDDWRDAYMTAFNGGEDIYDQLTTKTGDYFGGRYNYSVQDPLAKHRQLTFRGTNQGFDDLIRKGIVGYGTTEGNSGFDIYAGDRTGNRTLARGLSAEDVTRFNKQLATRGMELYDKGNGAYRLRKLQPTELPEVVVTAPKNTKSSLTNPMGPKGGGGFNLNVMPENVLALGRMVGGLAANNRAAKLYKEGLKPTLLDTFENIVPLQGNFQAVTNAEQQAGNLESMAARPRTSDASLQLAGELEASDRAGQARFQGSLQDAENFYRTRMLGQQESDAAKARRVDVANNNRASMNQVDAAKKQIDAARITSNYQNVIAPYLAGIENQFAQKRAINQQLDMEEAQRYAERIYSPQFDRLTEDFKAAKKAYGAANNEDYTGWETSNEHKALVNRRKTLNDEMSQFLLGRRRAIMGSPFMSQVTRTPYTSPVYIKAGGKLSAADREKLQRAKDFNKRLLEDNKQFHKDIMESKREHNKLIMSMSSLTSELIKKAMS